MQQRVKCLEDTMESVKHTQSTMLQKLDQLMHLLVNRPLLHPTSAQYQPIHLSTPPQNQPTCTSICTPASRSVSVQYHSTPASTPASDEPITPQSLSKENESPDVLITAETVLNKYSKLQGVSKAGALSVKLAREAFFGKSVLKQCTVHGCKSYPALPVEKQLELKELMRSVLKYSDCEFEDVWKLCEEAIGHACRTLRNPRKKLGLLNLHELVPGEQFMLLYCYYYTHNLLFTTTCIL